MKTSAPRLEPRRIADFERELLERARAWIPAWGLADGERDFGRALLEIAARFNSEVAERLDRVGDKMRAAFSTGSPCAARRQGRRECRWRFKLADTARAAVDAPHPVRMQVDAVGAQCLVRNRNRHSPRAGAASSSSWESIRTRMNCSCRRRD